MQRVTYVVFFVILLCYLSYKSREEYYHSSVEKTKEKNTDSKRKPAEPTTLIDGDRLSDTEECEPYLVGKIQVVAIRRHKMVICGEQKRKGAFSRKTLDPTD